MKQILRHIFVSLSSLVALALSSCNDNDGKDIIWDFAPVNIALDITDENGNNLLDTETPGNILDSGITATFDGVTYRVKDISDMPGEQPAGKGVTSRDIPAIFYGLYLYDESFMDDDMELYFEPKLCFGEFPGFENFDNTVVFHFPSVGKDVTVRIVSTARWNGDNPDWRVNYFLDGTLLDNEQIIHGIPLVLTAS